MRLIVVAVGRMKAGPERELFGRYVERVGVLAASVGFSHIQWREVPEGRSGRVEDRRAEEARAILAAVPKDGWLAALDQRGAADDVAGGRNRSRATAPIPPMPSSSAARTVLI